MLTLVDVWRRERDVARASAVPDFVQLTELRVAIARAEERLALAKMSNNVDELRELRAFQLSIREAYDKAWGTETFNQQGGA